MSAPRSTALLIALAVLTAAGCSGDQTAVTVAPTSTTTTAVTTTSEAVTTTAPFRTIAVAVTPEADTAADDAADVGFLLTAFYTWLADRDAPRPTLPGGLTEHLGDTVSGPGRPLTAELVTRRAVGRGYVGVVTVEGEDVFLVVSDDHDPGWRIVGAWPRGLGLEPWFGDPIRRVLIIGTDAREWQDPIRFRADSIHVVTSNTDEQAGGVLGFPRDSWIEAPYGTDKFTHVNAVIWTESDRALESSIASLVEGEPYFGTWARSVGSREVDATLRRRPLGQEAMVAVTEALTGLEIEGYLSTGFDDFRTLFHEYGPIEVDIPFAMADSASGAFFEAGVQTLWGSHALAFSRNRHIGGGDFTRSLHQGLVIIARLEALLNDDFTALPELIAGLVRYTSTDLDLEQLMTLGASAFLVDPGNVGNAVVPGSVTTRGGASVVVLADSAEQYYRDLDDGILGNAVPIAADD